MEESRRYRRVRRPESREGYPKEDSRRASGDEQDLRRARRRDGVVRDHRGAVRETETDRERYYRERDEYFAERDRYYRERDRYYEELDETLDHTEDYETDSYPYYDDIDEEESFSYSGRSDVQDRYSGKNSYAEKDRHAERSLDPEKGEYIERGFRSGKNEHTERTEHIEKNRKTERDKITDKTNPGKGGHYGKDEYADNARNTERNRHAGQSGDSGSGKKKKSILPKLIALLLAALAAFLAFKFVTRQSGYYTVAVFGVDSRDGNVGKGALSDVNIIARVDMSTGEIKLVSIYRDTYTRIDSDGNYHKFNEAYFRGGPEQAVWALEHNTDVKVDDYATFNWKAVVDAINILGGIDVEISDSEFKYINAFITETVNSTGVGSVQLEHAGMNHLDGVQAVAYARLRKMDDDYTRTERQRRVVSLAFEKAKQADFATLNNILVTVLPQISTSIGIDDLLPFARNFSKYYLGDTAGFPFEKRGVDVGSLDCVVPVTWESNDIALHEFLYPGAAYTPSDMVKNISAHVIERTGLGGSGSTNVSVDELGSGSGGSATIQTPESSAEAQAESEAESESETGIIESIQDPFMDGSEAENDTDPETETENGSDDRTDGTSPGPSAGDRNNGTADDDNETERNSDNDISETGRHGNDEPTAPAESSGSSADDMPSGNINHETAQNGTVQEEIVDQNSPAAEAPTESYAVINGSGSGTGPGA